MIFCLVLLFSLLFSDLVVTSQNIQFYREDLSYKISGKYFTVEGCYYFYNATSSPGKTMLFYPFPKGEDFGPVDSVEVTMMPELQNIRFHTGREGITFPVQVDPYNARKYKIKYRQKLFADKAEYILLTALQWKKPLEEVNIKLTTPKDHFVDSVSYRADTTYISNNSYNYVWHMNNFVPDKNMEIYFHTKRIKAKKGSN
jgi:hypothetical protein